MFHFISALGITMSCLRLLIFSGQFRLLQNAVILCVSGIIRVLG